MTRLIWNPDLSTAPDAGPILLSLETEQGIAFSKEGYYNSRTKTFHLPDGPSVMSTAARVRAWAYMPLPYRGRNLPGERNSNAKLTEAQVRTIIKLRGHCTAKTVARVYAVAPSTIFDIWRGHTWSHVR